MSKEEGRPGTAERPKEGQELAAGSKPLAKDNPGLQDVRAPFVCFLPESLNCKDFSFFSNICEGCFFNEVRQYINAGLNTHFCENLASEHHSLGFPPLFFRGNACVCVFFSHQFFRGKKCPVDVVPVLDYSRGILDGAVEWFHFPRIIGIVHALDVGILHLSRCLRYLRARGHAFPTRSTRRPALSCRE